MEETEHGLDPREKTIFFIPYTGFHAKGPSSKSTFAGRRTTSEEVFGPMGDNLSAKAEAFTISLTKGLSSFGQAQPDRAKIRRP